MMLKAIFGFAAILPAIISGSPLQLKDETVSASQSNVTDIYTTLLNYGNFSTFANILNSTGYQDMLSSNSTGQNYTVFAPTDASLANIFANLTEPLKSILTWNIAQIFSRQYVGYHIGNTTFTTANVTSTGQNVTIPTLFDSFNLTAYQQTSSDNTTAVYVNNAQIVISDIMAANGYIQGIDSFISPMWSISLNMSNPMNNTNATQTTPIDVPVSIPVDLPPVPGNNSSNSTDSYKIPGVDFTVPLPAGA